MEQDAIIEPFTNSMLKIPDLIERARDNGMDLRASFGRIVTAIAGPAPRPSIVASLLGIDKSLASKVVRATKVSDPLQVLHSAPAPRGLLIVVEAAARIGVSPELCREAEAIIKQFQSLIDEFDGGRADFEIALDSFIPSAQDTGMRRASQAAYKCLSYVLGFRRDVNFATSFIHPSANGTHCDDLQISGNLGLRRLGPPAPMSIFTGNIVEDGEITAESVSWECINGEPIGSDYQKIVLKDFSSPELPHLEVFPTHTQQRLQIPRDGLAINTPIDIVTAVVMRNIHLRYKVPPQNYLYVLRTQKPCRVMVMDVFLHKDVCPGARHEVITRSWGPGPVLPIINPDDKEIDTLPTPVDRTEFDLGLSNIGISDIPRYDQMVDSALDQIGWNRAEFRGYRIRCQYPLPIIMYGHLFEMPDAPGLTP